MMKGRSKENLRKGKGTSTLRLAMLAVVTMIAAVGARAQTYYVFYNDIFYDNVKDIPLVKELRYIEEFGMPTNLTISTDPTVTVVPKGTTLYIGYCSRRFVFPKVEE